MLDVYNRGAGGARSQKPFGRTRPLRVPNQTPVWHNLKLENQTKNCSVRPCIMKRVPAVLLIASVLLTAYMPLSVCRPRDLSVLDGRGYRNRLDEVLLRAGDGAVSYLAGEKLLQYLQRNPAWPRSVSRSPYDSALAALTSARLQPAARRAPTTDEGGRAQDEDGGSLEELVELTKRNEDPPISIDLTFHLLRNMIEMARIENQREQAELNRKYLDEVGK